MATPHVEPDHPPRDAAGRAAADRPVPGVSHRAVPSLLAASRFLVLVAVVCTFAGATTLLLAGALDTVQAVTDFIRHRPTDIQGVRHLLLEFIEVVEIFLVAMVMYLICVGFYTLFVDSSLPVPAWMAAHSLDDLKDKLVSVVSATLGVLFLGQVVTWDGERDLLRLGAGIAAVIVALTVFLASHGGQDG